MRCFVWWALLLSLCGVLRAVEPVHLPGIENAFDLGSGVWSGGAPVGDAAFAELARRGVKTIVSVDGARPDVAAARRAGLRTIHLPFGYDGIPTHLTAALAKLATTETAPIFIHCHHGKHRGPAAAAILCTARAGWSAAQGEAWLREAGTSPDYPGLYRSVREFRLPAPEALAQVVAAFPETTPAPPLVNAMVAIDQIFDALKAARNRGWSNPPEDAATLLGEHFRELHRAEASAELRLGFSGAEQAAAALREALREPGAAARLEVAWTQVAARCTDCHREHRNSVTRGPSIRALDFTRRD